MSGVKDAWLILCLCEPSRPTQMSDHKSRWQFSFGPCLHLVIKCILDRQDTCIFRFRYCLCHLHSKIIYVKNIKPAAYLLYFNAPQPCTTIIFTLLFFFIGVLSQKLPCPALINNVSSCYILVRDASGHISVYTTKHTGSNASQTSSASGSSECVLRVF